MKKIKRFWTRLAKEKNLFIKIEEDGESERERKNEKRGQKKTAQMNNRRPHICCSNVYIVSQHIDALRNSLSHSLSLSLSLLLFKSFSCSHCVLFFRRLHTKRLLQCYPLSTLFFSTCFLNVYFSLCVVLLLLWF